MGKLPYCGIKGETLYYQDLFYEGQKWVDRPVAIAIQYGNL